MADEEVRAVRIQKRIPGLLIRGLRKTHKCIISRAAQTAFKEAWKGNIEKEGLFYGKFKVVGGNSIWEIQGVTGIYNDTPERAHLRTGVPVGEGMKGATVSSDKTGELGAYLRDFRKIRGLNVKKYVELQEENESFYYKRIIDGFKEGKYMAREREKLKATGWDFLGEFHTHPHVEYRKAQIFPIQRAGAYEGLLHSLNFEDYFDMTTQCYALSKVIEFPPLNILLRDRIRSNEMKVDAYAFVVRKRWRRADQYMMVEVSAQGEEEE